MGTQAQKKKLWSGMSSSNARRTIRDIFKERFQGKSINSLNKQFLEEHGISLWALCEMWHGLRARNKPLDMVCEAFAEQCARKNDKIRELETTIANQRKVLSNCGLPRSAAEAERRQVFESHQQQWPCVGQMDPVVTSSGDGS